MSRASTGSRRTFLTRLGGTAAALAVDACAPGGKAGLSTTPSSAATGEWDVTWIDRVRRARHRAVFDSPSGDNGLQLAARYLNNVATVYALAAPDVAAVLNIRTRAVSLALTDAVWAKYPIGEDATVTDPATGAQARRNINYAPAADAAPAYAEATIVRLVQRGAIILVCDFALGHLSKRLAEKRGTTEEVVHAELRRGLVSGAIAVPSGIFSVAEAQNAGCAFVPA